MMQMMSRMSKRVPNSECRRNSLPQSRFIVPVLVVLSLIFVGPNVTTVRGQAVDALQSLGVPNFPANIPVEMGYINPVNGNLHIEIPLGSYKQRGGRVIKLWYQENSDYWTQVGTCGSCTYWDPPSAGAYPSPAGWPITSTDDPGYADYVWADQGRPCSLDGIYKYTYFNNWVYVDGAGGVHQFPIRTVEGWISQCWNGTNYNQPNGDAVALDSSGYHMFVTNFTNVSVYGPDGSLVYAYYYPPQPTPPLTDSNGNYYLGDNMGRTLVTCTDYTKTNPVVCQVPNDAGGTSTYKFHTTVGNVSTNFHVTGGSSAYDYSGTFTYVTSIDLPDGTSYAFTHDFGTSPGNYGQIQSMTMPSGAQIQYSYQNFMDAMYAPSGHEIRPIKTRTTPKGTWSYTPLVVTQCTTSSSMCQQKMTVLKPSSNGRSDNTVFTFNIDGGTWPIEVDYYNGAVAPSNLVASLYQSFDYAQPCNPGFCGTPYLEPINVTMLSATTTLTNSGSSNVNQTTQYCYDAKLGNLLTKWEWDFYTTAIIHDPNPPRGAGCSIYTGVPTPYRTTTNTFLSGANYIYNNSNANPPVFRNITNRPASATISTGGGTQIAQTLYTYDDWAMPAGPTGVIDHDDTDFGQSFDYRGNLTQIKKWVNTSSSWLITKNYYDIVGNLIQTTDPNGNNTYFDYTDNFYAYTPSKPTNGYVTKTTSPVTSGVNHISRIQYYFGAGDASAKCGENFPSGTSCNYGLSTPQADYAQFTYDYMERPLSVVNGDGGTTSWTYSSYPCYATSTKQIDATHNLVRTTCVDGIGRTSQTQSSGGQGTTYVDTVYDPDDRVQSVSNPHISTSSPTDGITTYSSYDGLDRPTLVTEQDNSTVTTAYAGNCKTVTDEVQKARQTCIDGFGRVLKVFEDPGTAPHLNYETDYGYDLLDNLTSVVQSGSRNRSFTYDSLSRLLCASNPENSSAACPATATSSYTTGTTGYAYDSNGNLVTKTAPKPNQMGTTATVVTTYAYDTLNRLTQKSYNDGATATVQFGYDAIAPANCSPSLAMTYPVGRQTAMCDAAGYEGWSYDVMGRIAADQRTTNGSTKTTTYSTTSHAYNFDGSIAQLTYPSGRTLTYTPNIAGQQVSVVDSSNQYVLSASYTPPGQLQAVTLGQTGTFTGINLNQAFNPRLQPSSIRGWSTNGVALDLSYCFYPLTSGACPTTQQLNNNGNVTLISNNRDTTRSQNFTYDSLNRLSTAQTQTVGVTIPNSNCWGLTFGYDAWGNLLTSSTTGPTGCSEPSPLNATVSSANQMATNTVAGQTTNFCYDTAGNLIHMVTAPATCPASGPYQYTYDAENRLVSTAGYTYSYDGQGRRVAKSGAASKLYWYGITGEVLNESNVTGSVTDEYIFFNKMRTAHWNLSGGTLSYYFGDQLGSARVVTNSVGAVPSMDDTDFYPFGGERDVLSSSGNNYKFTGKERDSESGLDNFGARYDSSQYGRFMSPDPLGGKLIDPQTLNKYSYVRNNPINLTDPTGMYECEDDQNKCKTKQDIAFEKARQQDLKSKDSDVLRAAKSYGDPTKDNGVTVRFGDPGNGTGGNTASGVRQDPNDPNRYQAEETVTIRPGQSGTDLASTIGHEGSHVADAQDFVNSITATGGADQALNLTKYQTELKAYMVTQSILSSGNEQRSFGDCGMSLCILGTGIQPAQAQQTINQLLANPRNGYGVTPDRPGQVMYPNLTTPK